MDRRGLTAEERVGAFERYRRFQTHDMPIADDERALFDWASKQTYIALGNMLTGAAMLGIDSCAIEGMEYAVVEKSLPKPDCSILRITAYPSPQPSATVCATSPQNRAAMRRKR